MFTQMKEQQLDHLTRQQKKELSSDDYHITKKNFIDLNSLKTIHICDAWI